MLIRKIQITFTSPANMARYDLDSAAISLDDLESELIQDIYSAIEQNLDSELKRLNLNIEVI